MILDKYISDLLYRYDCVIVPGFGGFITNRVSTNSIDTQHKFIPPKKEIAFNKHLDKNDGLLANYLVQAKKISYIHAMEVISNAIADWNVLLEHDNGFEIKQIGYFRLNNSKILEFSSYDNKNYLTESYGLSTFTAIPIKRSGENKIKYIDKNINTDKPNYISKLVKYAAIIIPFVSIGALSLYQANYSSNVSNANIGISSSTEIKKENNIPIKNKASNSYVVKSTKEELKYHIISGAFSDIHNADRSIKRLKDMGVVNAKIVGKNNKNLYMVSYASFSKIDNAKSYLSDIKEFDNNNAWIWKHIIE